MIRIFSKPKSANEVISLAVHELGKQYAYLKIALGRLEYRDKSLFDTCESMIIQGNRNRALIYACEIAEIRKLQETVKSAQLAIERVILRLETIREIGAVTKDLKSVLKETRKVTAQLSDVMPEVAYEMEKMNEMVSDVLATTVLSSAPPITTIALQTDEVKEIIEDAMKIAEEELISRIPEPPIIKAEETEIRLKEKLVPLPSELIDGFTSDMKSRQVGNLPNHEKACMKPEYSSLIEKWVLGYAEKNKGKIDVDKCASDLRVLSNDVIKALASLRFQGKIRIES